MSVKMKRDHMIIGIWSVDRRTGCAFSLSQKFPYLFIDISRPIFFISLEFGLDPIIPKSEKLSEIQDNSSAI